MFFSRGWGPMTSMLEPPKMIGSYSKNLTEKKGKGAKKSRRGGMGSNFPKSTLEECSTEDVYQI